MTRGSEKLSPRFFGPYPILRQVNPVAYELQLPADARIHLIFHVSLLKSAYGQTVSQPLPELPISDDLEYVVLPEDILAHRWRRNVPDEVLELLIKWKTRPFEEATWESYDLFRSTFPFYPLGDKADFRGGNVRPPINIKYERKSRRLEVNKSNKSPDL